MLTLLRSHRDRPTAEPKTLLAGDFMFTGNGPGDEPILVGIERKRMRDMVNSLRGGRLAGEQIPKLLRYDQPYIIFESRWKTDWVTGQAVEKWGRDWTPVLSGTKQIITGLEIQSALNDIQDKTLIKILHTEDPKQTVELVVQLAYSWAKPWDKRNHHLDLHRPVQYQSADKASTVRRVAFALNGIGWEKSLEIESHFPTVEAMVGATVQEWGKLPGFGKVLSRKIYGQLHGQFQED
jgi:ERCC4-type nuclease